MRNSRLLSAMALGAGVLFADTALAHSVQGDSDTTHVLVTLVLRWMHILPAIFAVGGSFFIFAVLMPSAKQVLDDETHANLRAAIMKRWKIIIHTCILLFLLSGFYNYLMITRFEHQGNGMYHMLFGIKFLLAMLVFFLAVCLTSSKNWATTFTKNAPFWTRILVLTAIVVVLIAGYMKVMPHPV